MSFNIGLSGMRAASKDLNVTGNNIANAGTIGFKSSRAEFADVYASSILGNGKNQSGSGVLLTQISQQFNQGNINYTTNPLDMAINGNGFFQVSNNGALSYTRAGYFGTDTQGYIVDGNGYNLQGYTIDANGNLQSGVVGNLQVQTGNQAPKATASIQQEINLNSSSIAPSIAFDPSNSNSYNWATSANVYDAQGNAHVMSRYFVKTGANSWSMYVQMDGSHPLAGEANQAALTELANNATATGANIQTAATTALTALGLAAGDPLFDAVSAVNVAGPPAMTATEAVAAIAAAGKSVATTPLAVTFDASGKIQPFTAGAGSGVYDPSTDTATPPAGPASTDYWQLNTDGTISLLATKWAPATLSGGNTSVLAANGVTSNSISFDLAGSTQYASSSAVASISQDGYTTGQFSGLEIDDKGVISARYTNGQTKVQGQVILANFANAQGLTPIGKSQWVMSSTSGEPVMNTPGSGTLGSLVSGALEDSNVELSDQLVNLIVAQRNYQANAKTIETESTVTQTLINLR